MRFYALTFAVVLLGWPIGRARAAEFSCAEAASLAEAGEALPPGLLLAIGLVESGRPGPAGTIRPWPWTIDVNGAGRFFDSAEAAVAAVTALRATGVQSIDIGCFQINLLHHPDAFADLAQGFAPRTNARAAARFLRTLYGELGSWNAAVAAYHSRTDARGAPYRDRVLAAWHGAPEGSTPDPHIIVIDLSRSSVIRVSGVRVWGPAGSLLADAATLARPAALPRVVTLGPR